MRIVEPLFIKRTELQIIWHLCLVHLVLACSRMKNEIKPSDPRGSFLVLISLLSNDRIYAHFLIGQCPNARRTAPGLFVVVLFSLGRMKTVHFLKKKASGPRPRKKIPPRPPPPR